MFPFCVVAKGRSITCDVIPVAVGSILLPLEFIIFVVSRVVFRIIVVDAMFKFVRA